MLVPLPDAYPELTNAQLVQLRRETELRAARRHGRRARLAATFRRGYAHAEEVR